MHADNSRLFIFLKKNLVHPNGKLSHLRKVQDEQRKSCPPPPGLQD